MIKEKRRHPRYDIELKAELFTGKEILPVTTRNLSKGGVSLILKKPIEEGTTVGLSLFITEDGIEDPDQEPLNIKAKLVWCAPQNDGSFIAGARFVELNKRESDILDSFIEIISQKNK